MKIYLLKGLPGSGKSTWAKDFCANNARSIRINKDDIRKMFSCKWNNNLEDLVLQVRDHTIINAMHKRYENIIVDDTNFAPRHESVVKGLADQFDYEFEVKLFDTPVDECIANDLKRMDSVGKDVIMDMYRKYVHPLPPIKELERGKDLSIVVDIDGTLAHMDGKRSPYDYSKVSDDRCDNIISSIVRDYKNMGLDIIVVSGRKEDCLEETTEWLEKNNIPFDMLLMRKSDDTREDSIVKKEIYETKIKPTFDVFFVLDDRDRVVRMWRELGLKTLQVNEGNF